MGKRVKLTARMVETLRALAEPKACAFYMPYMGRFNPNAYWFISVSGRCTAQINGLIARGLVEEYEHDWRGCKARITDAGRAWLAERDRNGK